MRLSFNFIMPAVAAGAVLLAIWPVPSRASSPTNTATGETALASLTTGTDNTADGIGALYDNTTGEDNTAAGNEALYDNTAGAYNTATGADALYGNINGYYNTADGVQALYYSGGSCNTAAGCRALLSNTTGSFNTAFGYSAGSALTSGSNNIDICNEGFAGESNTIRIGTSGSQTRIFIAGIVGSTITSGQQVVIDPSTGQLGTIAPVSSINSHKLNAALARLEQRNTMLESDTRNLRATVREQSQQLAAQQRLIAAQANRFASLNLTIAQQQQEIATLTTNLKEQATLLQKVSAQIQITKPAPRVVSNN